MLENGKRRSFDRAFKVEAVRLVTEEGRRVTEVARDLGINANQLHRWKRKLSEDGQLAFPGKGYLTPEQEEFRRLRRENAALREERDILKKSDGHLLEPPSVRYQFIWDHRKLFRIRKICEVLRVSKSGYYAWLSRPESNDRYGIA